ncbi:MAG: NeuD/PglB/VioB family sugar acetyltransferase [Vampirovibrio sp.]|nr:NeuD/PglB/VioB family sugar acetyltransferase [Vampirovibrio sp.]
MSSLVLLGCGGHARSVADVALFNDPNLTLVFVDENAREGETIWRFPVVKTLPQGNLPIHFAVGSNEGRKKLYTTQPPVSILSKKAHFGKNSSLGEGCFVAHQAYLGPDVQVGEVTILNTACVVEHEVSIGSFCHIAPNSTICGRVTIGDCVWVGVGAIVKEGLTICSNVTLGAGAVVVKNITEAGVYVGVPAKKLS